MAKLSEEVDGRSLADNIKPVYEKVSITTEPVLIVGVQAKANTGNYENVDIYTGLALPTGLASDVDLDTLTKRLEELAEYGFKVTSGEVFKRYHKVSIYGRDNTEESGEAED